MARPGLSRIFASISELSTPKPSFTGFVSESTIRSASNSASRFMCSSAQQPRSSHEEKANEEKPESVKEKLEIENEEEEEDGDHVNKETGEVGGPKGPEPTRYGDWERNGRCYDF
ncbi:hypothetical protein CCACVL1_08408 [Corchorus capsularis]|uniref:Succinate dehydrogenase assembly factor 4, mitochondrial n=1 Tax=Corchorus capsularis TaxID=210143 RepID=A0A1R3J0P5_COCAP|nr:hypothetical protein CCACVL1_08408 [Corchorus capsularis]